MFFNISCYIENITETYIKIKIIDPEILSKFQKNINGLYKTKKGKLVTNKHSSEIDTFNLKINKKTKFDLIGFSYSNLNNLIGTNINISGESKYYCFPVSNINNEINDFTEEIKYINGYSLICNKIYK
jgi:hypothetical protein